MLIGQIWNVQGRLQGGVTTLGMDINFALEPVADPRDGGPKFTVRAGKVELGGAWSKVITRGENAGDEYLSISIDDPSFPAPLHCAAFPTGDGNFDIVWNRPKASPGGAGARTGGGGRAGGPGGYADDPGPGGEADYGR